MIGRGNRENRGAQVPPILAGSDGIRVTWDPGEPLDPFCERSKVPSRLIPALTSVALRSAIHQPTGDWRGLRGDPLQGRAWSALAPLWLGQMMATPREHSRWLHAGSMVVGNERLSHRSTTRPSPCPFPPRASKMNRPAPDGMTTSRPC